MLVSRQRSLPLALCLGLGLVLIGCGGSNKIQVSGKVTKNGQPLTFPAPKGPVPPGVQVGLQVRLHPVAEGAAAGGPTSPFDATVNMQDSSFVVKGSDGRGIPPGKYRIAIEYWNPYPDKDELKGKFSDENTKIVREVSGDKPIEIDITKPN